MPTLSINFLLLKRKFNLRVSSCSDADGGFCSLSAAGEGSKNLETCSFEGYKQHKLGIQEDCEGTLESIWKKTTDFCQSNSLKNILKNRGKLSSLRFNQGKAVCYMSLSYIHTEH